MAVGHGRTSYGINLICGAIGIGIFGLLVLGLAHSISTGFAGFWGGFPFWVIAIFVLCLAGYDFWDECIRKHKPGEEEKTTPIDVV